VRLRDLFEDRLFVRTPGGMEPTARALELAGPIQRALRGIEDALRNSADFDPGRTRRTFVVGITEYAEIALVERLTELLRKRGDSIDLRLRSIAKVKYVELLDDGGIDAFVGHADEVPPRFLSASLLKDPLVLLARRGHPIFKTQIGMEDLVKWPQVLVSPTGEARGAVDPILKRKGVDRRVAITVGTYLGIPLALQKSDLTSNVPQQIAARLSKVLPLRSAPLPFCHVVTSELVWHSRNEADRAQIWLRGLIREAAQP
jgi:DNA-binding transcriptional LysR family regulator